MSTIPKSLREDLLAELLFINSLTDSSGNGYTLSNNGTTVTSDYLNRANRARNFVAASTQYLYNGTLLDTVPTGFTVSFWVSSTNGFSSASSTNEYLISKENISGADRFNILFDAATGSIRVFYEESNNGTLDLYSTTTTWTADVWRMVTFTWGTTNGAVLYIDTIAEDTNASDTTVMGNGTNNDFIIGSARTFAATLNGNMTAIRVWGREITDTNEIKQLYLRGIGTPI